MIQIGASSATIDSPIEHLGACHRRIEQRLDALVRAAGHIEKDRAAALAAIAGSLHFLDTSGALHTEDEEASLFPRLRQHLAASEIEFLDALETQHAEADAVSSELRKAQSELIVCAESSPSLVGRYRECAEKLRSLYRAHIAAEDEILTAISKRVLNDSEIAQISREMRDRRRRGPRA